MQKYQDACHGSLAFLAVDDGGDHLVVCVPKRAGHGGGHAGPPLDHGAQHRLLCAGILLKNAQGGACVGATETSVMPGVDQVALGLRRLQHLAVILSPTC